MFNLDPEYPSQPKGVYEEVRSWEVVFEQRPIYLQK